MAEKPWEFVMRRFAILAAAAAASGLAAPALAQDRWDWSPGPRAYRLVGAGVPLLFPELRNSPRGRAFMMRNFDRNRDGRVQPREADAANAAFARVAGPKYERGRDRFDWDRRGPLVVEERVVTGGWDRGAMRGYGFRQTARGATLRLQEDVLFRTDSDVLRPGAMEKLRPIAD